MGGERSGMVQVDSLRLNTTAEVVAALEACGRDVPARLRAHCLRGLADALKWNGSMDAARERYRQAEQVATAAGCVDVVWQVLNNLADGECHAGEPERAWAAVER